MIDYKKYFLTEDDISLLEDVKYTVFEEQLQLSLSCGDYSFLLEPVGFSGVQVWRNNEKIAEYSTFDELLLNFKIDGKPFIERVQDIEYE